MKTKVLFICSHNTTRSQMAQALLSKYGGEDFEVLSAGVNAGVLNPMAVEVISEAENMDISSYTTNSIIDYFKQVWDVSFTQVKNKGHYRLRCGTKEARKFLKIFLRIYLSRPNHLLLTRDCIMDFLLLD